MKQRNLIGVVAANVLSWCECTIDLMIKLQFVSGFHANVRMNSDSPMTAWFKIFKSRLTIAIFDFQKCSCNNYIMARYS